VKNRTVRNHYQALAMLAQRVLPSEGAINKVSVLLATRYEAAWQATEIGRKKIVTDIPVPDGWSSENLPEGVAAARQTSMDKFLEESTPIRKIPDRLRLTKADLPKVLQRKDGEDNVAGLAQIKVLLGTLYMKSDDEIDNTPANEFEPDELPVKDDFAPAVAAATE
jgi:hypothetical protein